MNFCPRLVYFSLKLIAFPLLLLGVISFSFNTAIAATKAIPNAILPLGGKGLVVDLNKYMGFKVGVSSTNAASNTVLVNTTQGDFVIQLFSTNAPNTVANFLDYVTNGNYNNMFFHRSVTNFIIQTGGFQAIGGLPAITNLGTIPSEYGISNTRGTVAMALFGTNPNSATTQWFINEKDNSSLLDNTNKIGNPPFTVFGKVVGTNGMAVVDQIVKLPIDNFSTIGFTNAAFSSVPLENWKTGQGVNFGNLVTVIKSSFVSLPYASCASQNTNIFSVSLQGSKLIVTPLSNSTTPITISVSAADTNGNAATLSFQVCTAKLHQSFNFPPLEVPYSPAGLSLSSIPISNTSGGGSSLLLNSGPGYFIPSNPNYIFFKSAGIITMTVTQPGTFFYYPASATSYIIIDRATQTISFPTIPDQLNKKVPYTFTPPNYPTSTSGLPVKIAVLSGLATISGKSVTLLGTGKVTLIATQGGNGNYFSATPVTNSFVVTQQ